MSKPKSARRSSQITARLIYVQRSPASSFPRDALLGRYSSPAGVTRTASGSLIVPGVRRQHPERRDQNSLRLLLPHRPSTPALRIAHSRTLLCSPTTCQTHEPAGLLIPPNAAIALCTRRRA